MTNSSRGPTGFSLGFDRDSLCDSFRLRIGHFLNFLICGDSDSARDYESVKAWREADVRFEGGAIKFETKRGCGRRARDKIRFPGLSYF